MGHGPSRTRRRLGALAAVALTAALAVPTAAMAADPWPVDGGNQFNTRFARSGPTGARAPQIAQAWKRTWDSPAVGTPIIGGEGGVYIGSEDGTVRAFVRTSGTLYWAKFIGGPIRGSLLKVGDYVYGVANAPNAPHLVALHWLTGEVKFSTQLDNQRDADACGGPNYSASRNIVVVGIGACQAEREGRTPRTRGGVVAVDATTGAIRWRTATVNPGFNGGGVSSTPVVWDQGGKLFVSTGKHYSGVPDLTTSALLRLELDTGAISGRFSVNEDSSTSNQLVDLRSREGFTSPPMGFAARGHGAFLGAGAEDGVYYLVDALTMAERSRTTLSPGEGPTGIAASSAWDGFRVIGVTRTPATYFSLNPDGGLAWAFPGGDLDHTGPVTVNASVVWSTDRLGFLDAHSRTSGQPLGRSFLGAASTGGVALYSRYVYAAIGQPGGSSGGIAVFR